MMDNEKCPADQQGEKIANVLNEIRKSIDMLILCVILSTAARSGDRIMFLGTLIIIVFGYVYYLVRQRR